MPCRNIIIFLKAAAAALVSTPTHAATFLLALGVAADGIFWVAGVSTYVNRICMYLDM